MPINPTVLLRDLFGLLLWSLQHLSDCRSNLHFVFVVSHYYVLFIVLFLLNHVKYFCQVGVFIVRVPESKEISV